jgi:FkbM family methyltransferase
MAVERVHTESSVKPNVARTQFKLRSRASVMATVIRLLARVTPYIETELIGLSSIVGKNDVCIDVGSAAGLYTLELSELVGPSGRVLSVEPLSIARPVWTRVLGARGQQNVTHSVLALGSEPGVSVMSVPVGRFGPVTGRSFLTRNSQGLGSNASFTRHMSIETAVDTLDALCVREKLSRLDFIKIDVEGAELQVMQGGRNSIKRFKPALLLEIEERHLARFGCKVDEIVSWLTTQGYDMYTWKHGWVKVDTVDSHARNYLFLRMPNEDSKAYSKMQKIAYSNET